MNYNKETILIKNIEQLKQTIKDRLYNNYELIVVDNKIMIKGVKCSKPQPKALEWFSSWVKNQYEKTPPSWFTGWVKNQYERDIEHQNQFNKQVLNRLDNVDKRLDNLVEKNNLKE